MGAFRLALLLLSGIFAAGTGSLYAAEPNLKNLIDQGYFHGTLPAPTGGVVFSGGPFGNVGVLSAKDTDPFAINARVPSVAYPREEKMFGQEFERQIEMLFAYLSTETPVFGGVMYGTLVSGLKENKDLDGSKAPGFHEFTFRPSLAIGFARVFALPNQLSIMPEAHIVYHYENMDEVRAGFGVGIRMAEDLSGHVGFDSTIQPGEPRHRAFLSFKYHW
jgi:hypothetical protein